MEVPIIAALSGLMLLLIAFRLPIKLAIRGEPDLEEPPTREDLERIVATERKQLAERSKDRE